MLIFESLHYINYRMAKWHNPQKLNSTEKTKNFIIFTLITLFLFKQNLNFLEEKIIWEQTRVQGRLRVHSFLLKLLQKYIMQIKYLWVFLSTDCTAIFVQTLITELFLYNVYLFMILKLNSIKTSSPPKIRSHHLAFPPSI